MSRNFKTVQTTDTKSMRAESKLCFRNSEKIGRGEIEEAGWSIVMKEDTINMTKCQKTESYG